MATNHQVTCIVPDGADNDQRIDVIGGPSGARDTNGPWTLDIDEAIAGVEDGRWKFWTTANGKSVWVIVAKRQNGRKYLKTEADGVEPNNLLSLPRCR